MVVLDKRHILRHIYYHLLHGAVTERLLQVGANVNGSSGSEGTQDALQLACYVEDMAITKRLLEAGASVSVP
jgi:hypothetical protein